MESRSLVECQSAVPARARVHRTCRFCSCPPCAASHRKRVPVAVLNQRLQSRLRASTIHRKTRWPLATVAANIAGTPVTYFGHVLLERVRSEEHTSELQSHVNLVCR